MNRTQYNLEAILHNYPQAESLGDLLKLVEDQFATKGEVVCQFIVNNLNLSEQDEKRIAQAPIDEVKTLEIESESPAVLLFGLLHNWITELPTLIHCTDQLAKEIRFGGIEGKLKGFIDLVDSCQFLIESLMNLESILHKESMNLEKWRKNKILTAQAIGDALHAFENKDFVQLSEVLEYDLGHSLQEWLDEIIQMQEYLKQENDKDSRRFSARIFEKRQPEKVGQADPVAGSSESTP